MQRQTENERKRLTGTDAAVYTLVNNRTDGAAFFSAVHRFMERREKVLSRGLGFRKSVVLQTRISMTIQNGIEDVFSENPSASIFSQQSKEHRARLEIARDSFFKQSSVIVSAIAATFLFGEAMRLGAKNYTAAKLADFLLWSEIGAYGLAYMFRLWRNMSKNFLESRDIGRAKELALINTMGWMPSQGQVEKVAKKLFEG